MAKTIVDITPMALDAKSYRDSANSNEGTCSLAPLDLLPSMLHFT